MPPQRGATDGSTTSEVTPPPPIDGTADASAGADAPSDRPAIGVDAGTGVDVGVGTGRPCQVLNNNCPAGSFCLSANCLTGTCVVASASVQESPQCGCDRLTYWNQAVAAGNGASVRIAGACPNGMVCGGNGNVDCPNGALCNLEQANQQSCNINNPIGRCWVLPDNCPPLGQGMTPTFRRCNAGGGNNNCQPICDLVAAGRTFFEDATCP